MPETQGWSRLLGTPLPPEERRRVLDELFVFGSENQRPFLHRMAVLLVVSTVIAACGLMADSAAVVIGAMLVAPLMRPVMAAAAAIALGWSRHLYRSLALVAALAFAAIFIAVAIAFVSPDFVHVPGQVAARTEPTFFDLVIALAAGSAGAFTITRKETSAIPGVAVAVALLPPLASAGILLDFGEFNLAVRAFVLFVINFLAMILAGSLTFLATGVVPPEVVSRFASFIKNHLLVFVALTLGISIPLSYYSRQVWFDAEYRAANSPELQRWLAANQLEIDRVAIDERGRVFHLGVVGPDPPMTIEGLYEAVTENRPDLREEKWRVEVTWSQRIRQAWPPPEASEAVARDTAVDRPPDPSRVAGIVWRWRVTQYNDEEWLGLEERGVYEFELLGGSVVAARVDCNRAQGDYELRDFYLRMTLRANTRALCPNDALDRAFQNDLNRVVNYRLVGDSLVLRLDNDAGLMYFEPAPRAAEDDANGEAVAP